MSFVFADARGIDNDEILFFRSISDSDGGKSPAILEEEEGGGGGEETKPECDTLIPAITVTNNRSSKPKIVRHRKSVHIIEPERDGNSNFKPT